MCDDGQLSVVTLYTELASSISDHDCKTDWIGYRNVANQPLKKAERSDAILGSAEYALLALIMVLKQQ